MTKNKFMVLVIIFVMVFTIALSGCKGEINETPNGDISEELADEQILRVNWAAEPPGLDPQTTTAALSIEIIRATMEGLVRPDQKGFIKKGSGLAEDWEMSEDGINYKFTLRDAKWSDGTDITSEDIKYSWLRALAPETAAEYAAMLYHIKGAEEYNKNEGSREDVAIKTPDPKTIEVELVRPTAQFLELTSFATLVPVQKAAVEKFGNDYAADAEKIVYSGPFIIKEWTHDQKLTLEKNPNYWDAENVKIQTIEGDMILDSNTAVNLYDTGGLDTIVVPMEFVDKYGDTDEYKIVPDSTTWYLQYNLTNNIMKNYNIRAAFARALDSESFVNNVLNGVGMVANGLTPPGMPGKDDKTFDAVRTSKSLTFDKAAAAKHLEDGLNELGITKEQLQNEVTFLAGDSSAWKLMTEAFQQMWRENLGLDIVVENVSYAIRLDRYNKKDYTLSLAGWGADYNDPMTFMDLFITNGGNNDAYYSNTEYDKLIDIAVNGTGDERIDAMLKAEELLVKDLPIHPVYHPVKDILEKPYVKDLVRYAVGCDNEYKWCYILKH
ncbi:peptide ABC transporter substrate-binding protein [Abyssisolibacter fermentans]|uniref:peptide ABC transporter substrate-binding protein n=1 Tax=Abyssisolibacter fermentans TaxID=1766203 RepID=UPI00082FC0E9|nr:peptide ABC transporter substrate-binding protein [Abyssisolibacter fermentans]